MTLAASLAHHALARPRHSALIAGEVVLDHATFEDVVSRSATALVTRGLAPGDIAGVCLPETIEHVVLMFALARAGIVMLPMDVRWTASEKTNVARHFGASAVFVAPDDAARPEARCIDVDWAWAAACAAAPRFEAAYPSESAGLLLSLSSGTTGRPKGPLVTHAQFLARFRTHWINLGLNARDRYVAATPLYFGGGRTFAMSVLYAGGTLVLAAPPQPVEAIAAEVERVQATSLFLVPTQLRALLAAPREVQTRLASLRLLVSSGAPLTRAERAAIRDRLCAGFFEYYASTEGGGTTLLAPEDQADHGDTVGRPIFGVEVEIVDDVHRPVAPGEIGRLRYRGPGCASGFWNDEQASREAFREGWFYPGDLASIDADGFVMLAGRAKEMIIRGGVNVYPAEIEAVLREHAGVADIAVLGVAHERLGEEVGAVVVPREAVDFEEITAWCAPRLAPYKIPSRWALAATLPRNAGGKIAKSALLALFPPRSI